MLLTSTRRHRSLPALVVMALLVAFAPGALLLGTAAPASALSTPALALTPPMGWNDWNAVLAATNGQTGCSVSEGMIEQTADFLVSSGLKDAGYQYVDIDDCWMLKTRAAGTNQLQYDPQKFPDGIKATADYVHAKGLKLGIYESAGTETCQGYPGSWGPGGSGYETQDAALFASWGVDLLKYDNCYNGNVSADPTDSRNDWIGRYTRMRDALAATGRPILYSICEWGQDNVWTWGAGVGHTWRTTGDIQPTYPSMLSIFKQNVQLAPYAGPGGWNDPDMLEVGNGMSFTEDRSEFSLWSEMAAPLIAGTDLTKASPATLSLYGDRGVIAVDQDSLGKQGVEQFSGNGAHVLAKPLAGGDVAVALFNENDAATTISTTASAVGLPAAASYQLNNLWSNVLTSTTGAISATVPGHGTVMYRVSVGNGSSTGTSHALVGASSNRCLDAYNNQTAPGTKIEIFDCKNDGSGNQTVTPTAAGELRLYGGTMCLDAVNNQTAPGTLVQLWSCNGGANQQFTLNPDGTVTGVQSGLCLDVTHGDTVAGNQDGTQLQLFTCDGGANQQWRLS
ncbi:glycoside hydrolase family 27 protein [Kitasatospora viridis]|uniref:Alpha-galactosidase n=1 Tax=Kitasatospora viridis TaxID=281105 RepID=A0A561UMY5_9ACTN|nr:alpha-galactosidase [Kitasatospora viridis]TWG00707.1 alpha-galactosidase [Kitasatospora viridis]